MNNHISWDHIRDIAERIGCEIDGVEHFVWDKPSEISWVEKAWAALTHKGLVSYENPCDKAYVKLQLLTLAAMYCKYLEVRCTLSIFIDYFEWFETVDIDLALLEIMVGAELSNTLKETEVYREDYQLPSDGANDYFEQETTMIYQDVDSFKVAEAIQVVIRMQRQYVFDALVSEFNGSSSLYISLLQTQVDTDCLRWIEDGMQPECNKLIKALS